MSKHTDPSSTDGIDIESYDGVERPYIPSGELDDDPLPIPGDVSLHTEMADDVDPVTYEVVRNSLFNINRQHGNIIQNLAVSNITLETRDFQTSISRENGDIVYFGPYIQFFSGIIDYSIKWVLENRSDQLDIKPGDMFLHNEPWVGTPHQPDVVLLCPVFHKDEIFCWVSNVMHHNDVGGVAPGSFCQNAQNIYHDPPVTPPVKIVEGGDLRQDMVDQLQRFSRTPENVALDIRAAVAGNDRTRQNVKDLIEKYDAEAVKKVMDEITVQSEEKVDEVLDKVPDGEWEARVYHEASMTGDRGVYEVRAQLRKEGDNLRFTANGTDPNTGVINCPFAAWRGAILTMANLQMIPGEMGAVGGVEEKIDVIPNPETLLTPDPEVSVSASIYGAVLVHSLANKLISQMLLSSQDPDIRKKATGQTFSQWALPGIDGTTQDGTYFVGSFLEQMIGSGRATPYKDGDFANGLSWVPEGKGPNVEANERDWPVLYLFRGEQQNSGGHGFRRGGNGGELGIVSHKGDVNLAIYTNDSVPKTLGLMGGGPGSRCQTWVVRDSVIQDQLGDDELPDDRFDLQGGSEHPPGKGFNVDMTEDDVLVWAWMGSGGYGDPLDREPKRVRADVEHDRISREVARETFGVVLDEDGSVDAEATDDARRRLREQRLADAGADAGSVTDHTTGIANVRRSDAQTIGDYVVISEGTYRCSHCDHELAAVGEDFKEGLELNEKAIEDLGPHWIDPEHLIDEEMMFREFFCPSCATRMSTEVTHPDGERVTDFHLEPE